MLFALIARDKPNSVDLRLLTRPAHIDYLKTSTGVTQAGPLLSDSGTTVGSLIILDLPDRAAAEAWASDDPYMRAGLFNSVQIIAWNRVMG